MNNVHAQSSPSFKDFWPIYVRLHSKKPTRLLHACATLSAIALVATALMTRKPLLLLLVPIVDYAIAQISHRLFERNVTRPWLHPLLHARAEIYMLLLTLTGKMDKEVERYASST